MKRFFTQILLLLFVTTAMAQAEYYSSIDGTKGGATLKDALYNLIKEHKQISYGSGSGSTWGAFYTTDAVVENGKRRVLDMYSNEKRYFGDQGEAISGMNIEHSVAKSWWGGTKNNAYCDLHHLNPSDQDANSRKSNYPLGELTSVSWDNGVTFVGTANIDGSSQNAYEPCDEYKGDFARTYMYMFTCYQNLTWKKTQMNYENSTYPTLKPWAVKLLLKWHKQDPVSEKEVNRNNAVYAVQGNRNPYIDYPQLADYVWGDSINYVFHLNVDVEDGSGNTGGGNIGGENPDNETTWKELINENFDGEEMVFTTKETVGEFPWELSPIYKMAIATSYISDTKANNNAESWLVSPSMDFSNVEQAKISFDYVVRYCKEGMASEYHQLLIGCNYNGDVEEISWDIIDFGATVNDINWELTEVKDIEIPEKYLGEKNVTIAFYYKGTTEKAGTFEVDNVVLQALEGDGDSDGNEGSGEGNTGSGDKDEEDNTGGNGGNFNSEGFTLVTDASLLTVGDTILIAYENFVMGASAGNYRQKTDFIASNGIVTYLAEDAQKIVLEKGAVDGTFAFNIGGGYLAATSSSKNYITTTEAIDANGSWIIEINDDALATITAQGDKERNILQYNTSSPRFSCYIGGQKSVNIYTKSRIATSIAGIQTNKQVCVYSICGVCVRKNIERDDALSGLEKGIYLIDNKKVLVK